MTCCGFIFQSLTRDVLFMNYQKLQQRFPLLKSFSGNATNSYLFNFENQLFEIPKHTITQSELELLRIFSGPITFPNDYDTAWSDYLTNQTNEVPKTIYQHRILFLHFDKAFTTPTLLRTAFEALLGKDIILISLNPQLIAIIECIENDELLDFSLYLDLLLEDLKTNFKIFVSDIMPDMTMTKQRFNWLVDLQQSLWSYTAKHVLTQQELLVPYLSLQLGLHEKNIFISSILKEATSQPDLVHTIKQLLKYEGNITLAAKKMFMHRNTLQNRLEKFQHLTQKDIRQFEHRLEVFLAISFLESS
jgi:DNA-binding protein Fis